MDKAKEERAIELFKKGYSYRKISEELGIGRKYITDYLKNQGYVNEQNSIPEWKIEKAIELFNEGYSYNKIGEELNIYRKTIAKHLKSRGYKKRLSEKQKEQILKQKKIAEIISIKHICKNCRKEFKHKSGGDNSNIFCSRECSFEYKHNNTGRYCKVCGKELKANEYDYCSLGCKNKDYTKICEYCGKKFIADVMQQKYCSDKCIEEVIKQYYKENRQELLEKARQRKVEQFKPKTFVCKECGKRHTISYGEKRTDFCSDECGNKFSRRKAKVRKKKRLKKNGKIDYDITLPKLMKRDNNICKICGQVCNSDDYDVDKEGNFITGGTYPSIDHIIPVSKGGTHTWDNVQLAHFKCNSDKSDNMYLEVERSGQLKIV